MEGVAVKMLHFAVLGDVHHVRPESHLEVLSGRPRGVTEYADVTRNLELTRTSVPRVLEEVRDSKPQFIMQLGDLVQGHCDDQTGTDIEMFEGVEKMKALGIPCTFAVASHDGRPGSVGGHAVDQFMRPCIESFLGRSCPTNYYSFIKERTLFLVLDYLTFKTGDEQDQWLEKTLADHTGRSMSHPIQHILMFAHVPSVPIGRPFFSPLPFVKAVQDRMARYPIEAYFCGHTHNQVATLHQFGQHWSAHLKSSILGFRDHSVRLEDVREVLPPAHEDSFEYGWGYLEDSMPGWWEVFIDGPEVRVEWRVHTQGVQGELRWRSGEKPDFARRPQTPSSRGSLPALQMIESVRLRVGGMGARAPVYEVTLNGEVVGRIETMEYFDVRQFMPLDRQFWPLLRSVNHLSIATSDEPICVGGFVLEVQTKAGHIIRSTVSKGLVTNSSRWDAWQEPSLQRINPHEPIVMEVRFES